MRSLLWVLALFALAVGISLAMHVNDGYVLLVLPPYRAELSLNLAILLILFGFAALYAFLRAASLTLSLPRRVREYRARHAREKALTAFGEGVRLYLDGSLREALAKAAEVRGDGEWPKLAAMLAADAARRLGDENAKELWHSRFAALREGRAPEDLGTPPPGGHPR